MTRHRLITICALTLVILSTRFAFAEETVDAFTPPEGLHDGWYARIETSKGRIIAQLLPGQAPQAVAYFAAMAEGRLEWFDRNSGELKKGHYYDGIEVHRVIGGIQFDAGDPLGTGYGAPDLFVPREGMGPVNFSGAGRLGLVRDGGAVSAVLFFVTAAARPRYNNFNPCFGVVVSGREVVINVSTAKARPDGVPFDAPIIEKILQRSNELVD